MPVASNVWDYRSIFVAIPSTISKFEEHQTNLIYEKEFLSLFTCFNIARMCYLS